MSELYGNETIGVSPNFFLKQSQINVLMIPLKLNMVYTQISLLDHVRRVPRVKNKFDFVDILCTGGYRDHTSVW